MWRRHTQSGHSALMARSMQGTDISEDLSNFPMVAKVIGTHHEDHQLGSLPLVDHVPKALSPSSELVDSSWGIEFSQHLLHSDAGEAADFHVARDTYCGEALAQSSSVR